MPDVEDSEDLAFKVAQIENEARNARNEREKLNEEVQKLAAARNELNEKVRALITTAKDEKDLRDQKNQIIAQMKEERIKTEEEIEELKKIYDEKKAALEKLPEREEKRKRTHARVLRNEIKKLEWKLQTERMSREEENNLVEQIAQLEEEYETKKGRDQLLRELRNLDKQLELKDGQLRSTSYHLRKKSRESRTHHRTMIQAFKQADANRKEADRIHRDFVTKKELADATHKKYIEKIRQVRTFHTQLLEKRQTDRKVAQEVTKAKKEAQVEDALKKFKSGKKLSFEEFRSLIDRGLI
ncbi:MAG: coiled-coil protein [Candidatus Hermodarchaeota archaeon]